MNDDARKAEKNVVKKLSEICDSKVYILRFLSQLREVKRCRINIIVRCLHRHTRAMKMFGTSSTRFGVFCFALFCHAVSTQARVKTNTEVDCGLIQSQPYYSLSDVSGANCFTFIMLKTAKVLLNYL